MGRAERLGPVADGKLVSTLTPRSYLCPRAEAPPPFDGNLESGAWAKAPWTSDFVDISTTVTPRFRTRAKMLWDDAGFYIAAEIEEPHVWATLTERDSVIFHDNDFEVFLDPDGDGHRYVELEMNALNTVWDLLLVRPYRAGGPPVDGFDLKGLRTHVTVRGTLNDFKDKDQGWTAEIMIPWAALQQVAGVACPPKEGDQWRINFSRVQWQVDEAGKKRPNMPEDNWVWSPQGVIDMHRPERWGVVQFGGELRPYPGLAEYQILAKAWETPEALPPGVRRFTVNDYFELHLGEFCIDRDLRTWRAKG